MKTENKIKSFTDLIAWKKGHRLVISVYQLTSKFPKKEVYCLTSQIRRCAISITSNLAEGFSRRGKKEKIQFYYISLGSLTELRNQPLVAKDVGYLNKEEFQDIAKDTVEVSKLINGLVRGAKK